jgi:hypothetical protein
MKNQLKRPQRRSLSNLFYFVGALLFIFSPPALAEESFQDYEKHPMIRVSEANDAVQPPGRKSTDRETSNIQTLEFISSLKDRPSDLVELIFEKTSIALFGKEYQRFWTGFEMTQTMLTPDRPDEEGPKIRQRPPAGLLLYGFYNNGENQEQKVSRKVGVWVGLLGPLSGAGYLQNWVHENILSGGEEALTWKHQMGNTPVFIAGFEQSQKIREYHPWSNDVGFNVITREGLYLGSSTSAASAIEFQLGWNPERHNQFGATRIGPQYTTDISLDPLGLVKPLSTAFLQSFFVFSSIHLDFIVHDQTLTVRTIAPRPLVFKMIQGFGMVFNLWNYPISITLAATEETKRYDEQPGGDHSFVSLSISGFLPPFKSRKKNP